MHAFEVFCAKYTVFTIYILATLAGLVSLVTGLVYFFIFKHHEQFAVQQLWSFSFLLIVIGIVVFLFAFMGSCGTISRSSCLLFIPTFLLTIILILQCGIGIFGALKLDQADVVWDGIFNNTFKNYESNKEVWDFMQRELQCCGIEQSTDWPNSDEKLPDSCCTEMKENPTCTTTNAFKLGCKSAFFTFLKANSTVIVSILFGITLVQILTIAYSCFLYGVFRKKKHYDRINAIF